MELSAKIVDYFQLLTIFAKCFPLDAWLDYNELPKDTTVQKYRIINLVDYVYNCSTTEPFKHQSEKMVKHSQTIRRQSADELFECVWSFCEIGV